MLSHPWRVLDPEEADLFYVPIYPALSWKLRKRRCGGLTHTDLMDASVKYLTSSSLFFNRFGGADHVLACAWWDCSNGLGPKNRMLLHRAVVGMNERLFWWTTRWGCGQGKMVTVPYTASSVLATEDMIGGRTGDERDIPFFFVGTARGRPERENLDVVTDIAKGSVVILGDHQSNWGMNSTQCAEHMTRSSRFCFSPRGDTESSRRLFDALAAGCTPIVTEATVPVLPFSETALNYSDFAVVVDSAGFSTRASVKGVVRDVLSSRYESANYLLVSMTATAAALVSAKAGAATCRTYRESGPFPTVLTNQSYVLAGGRGKQDDMRSADMWTCPETGLNEEELAPRTSAQLPPPTDKTREWLAESETIVVMERSLLFCAAPNTGSLQFRMLAKRMQGLPHWSVSNNRSLLFDREASGLELLDTTDGQLMKEIYSDNGSGWIKMAVVREPVTRLLFSYLDLVDTWQAGLILQRQPQDNAAQVARGRAAPARSRPLESIDNDASRQCRGDASMRVFALRTSPPRVRVSLSLSLSLFLSLALALSLSLSLFVLSLSHTPWFWLQCNAVVVLLCSQRYLAVHARPKTRLILTNCHRDWPSRVPITTDDGSCSGGQRQNVRTTTKTTPPRATTSSLMAAMRFAFRLLRRCWKPSRPTFGAPPWRFGRCLACVASADLPSITSFRSRGCRKPPQRWSSLSQAISGRRSGSRGGDHTHSWTSTMVGARGGEQEPAEARA
ncbi:unnamed protein product [Ectocarpus sp. 6 AP-2014]